MKRQSTKILLQLNDFFISMKPKSEPGSLKKILISGIAAATVIWLLWLISFFSNYPVIIGSFGASIFLLLAVPKSEFSRVKNLLGGHFLASLIGLTCSQIFGMEFWVLPISLCLTVIGMQLLGVSHPPAASNPVIIFFSSPDWTFLLVPTFIGSVILAIFAYFYHKVFLRLEF